MQDLFLGLLAFSSSVAAASYHPPLHARASAEVPIASVQNGSYYGVHNSNYNQDFFLGIPFAQPPLGDLRFAIPKSLNSTWVGALPATNYAFVSTSSRDETGYREAQ